MFCVIYFCHFKKLQTRTEKYFGTLRGVFEGCGNAQICEKKIAKKKNRKEEETENRKKITFFVIACCLHMYVMCVGVCVCVCVNGRNKNKEEIAIELEECHFTWDDENNNIALTGINVSFQRGTISMIIGETASGKSALLNGILGNINKSSGNIKYYNPPLNTIEKQRNEKFLKCSYSSQVAWIQNATLKDNILFGKPFNKKLYDAVIYACALTQDLQILPAKDQTEIGEKGINLSGGQKQR